MISGYVDFGTNRTWATVRVQYSYDNSYFYVDDVEVSITSWTTYNRVTDGYIKVNGYTIDSGGLQFIPTTADFYSLGISGSVPLTSSVTISFHAKNWSGWYAVTDYSEYQFMINDGSSATINTTGDSGGDSGGGNWETDGKCTLHINEGNGTKITVQRTWSDFGDYGNVYLSDGDAIYYPADRFQITAEALPGYKIDYYTSDDGEYLPFIMDNLTKPDDGEPYQLSRNLDATVSSTATVDTGVRIDGDTKYRCCIDTEHVVYPENISQCSIIGQRSCKGYYDVSLENDYDTISNGYWGACRIGGQDVLYYSYHLKFKTPEYIDNPANITVKIKMKGHDTYIDSVKTMRYALCSSDVNYQLYGMTSSEVSDEHQVASGTFDENTDAGGISSITINNVPLEPDTIYYLIVWDAHFNTSPGDKTYVSHAGEHSVVVDYTGNDPIYYTKYDFYIPYIDNGTSWEPF